MKDNYLRHVLDSFTEHFKKLWETASNETTVFLKSDQYLELLRTNQIDSYLSNAGINIIEGYDINHVTKDCVTISQKKNVKFNEHPNYLFFDDLKDVKNRFDISDASIKVSRFDATFNIPDFRGNFKYIIDYIAQELKKRLTEDNKFIKGQKLNLKWDLVETGDFDLHLRISVTQIYVDKQHIISYKHFEGYSKDSPFYKNFKKYSPESLPNPEWASIEDIANKIVNEKLKREVVAEFKQLPEHCESRILTSADVKADVLNELSS